MVLTELEIPQQNRLEEISKYLYQACQEQGLSLELVEKQTRIQKYQLRAIEQENLDKLPLSIYIREFIKIYADVLGCDGKALALTLPSSMNGSNLVRLKR